uniref:IS4 family transposase n=1 Tax=Cyanophyceae TaxID=3028117 RepID=UPI0016858056
ASGFPLGISSVQMWSRPAERPDKHTRRDKQLPLEEKESLKWLESAASSQRCFELGGATTVTYIGDREADIYEQWVTVPNHQTHVLIRACRDRLLVGTRETLFTHLSQQPCTGTYTLQVMADERKKRVAREALMTLRYCQVQCLRPRRLDGTDYPHSVVLYAVEAVEINPPPGQAPVHWRLLTTHRVVCLEQALQVIAWYGWRWRIEQLFATLKQSGLNLEATQLESGAAIQRLCVLALSPAMRVLQLTQGREDLTQSATVVFCDAQQRCLTELAPTLNGRTPKQHNPFPPLTLAWASWLIARLGGWSGYQSQRVPGIVTLFQGLRQIDSQFLGWSLASCPDVYTR